MIEYKIGDTIEIRSMFGYGSTFYAVVTEKHEEVKNGRPGFSATALDGSEVWGYDSQVRRVYARKAVAA